MTKLLNMAIYVNRPILLLEFKFLYISCTQTFKVPGGLGGSADWLPCLVGAGRRTATNGAGALASSWPHLRHTQTLLCPLVRLGSTQGAPATTTRKGQIPRDCGERLKIRKDKLPCALGALVTNPAVFWQEGKRGRGRVLKPEAVWLEELG